MVKPWLIYNNPALWEVDFQFRAKNWLWSMLFSISKLPTATPQKKKKITNSTRIHDWGIIGVVTPND